MPTSTNFVKAAFWRRSLSGLLSAIEENGAGIPRSVITGAISFLSRRNYVLCVSKNVAVCNANTNFAIGTVNNRQCERRQLFLKEFREGRSIGSFSMRGEPRDRLNGLVLQGSERVHRDMATNQLSGYHWRIKGIEIATK